MKLKINFSFFFLSMKTATSFILFFFKKLILCDFQLSSFYTSAGYVHFLYTSLFFFFFLDLEM